jgi:hypothetical protein
MTFDGTDHFGSTDYEGRIILKVLVEKWGVKVWNGFT